MGIQIGDFSPLAAMMTGKGALGKAMRQGFGGAIPQALARDAYSDEEEKLRALAAQQAMGMKKGGAVKSSASKRADGIAQRGKTRGRMV